MGVADGLAEFGIPVILICAAGLIALASLALHLLFPPSNGKCPINPILPTESADTKANQSTTRT